MVKSQSQTIFDQQHYVALVAARGDTIRRLVPQLKKVLQISTALDVGCGLGFFAQILSENELKVLGIDGRQVNVNEARHRYPALKFEARDIDDSSTAGLGAFDLVLCFGLLYHLENPLRAVRHLRALSGKVLLLESMCLASDEPFALLRDEHGTDDQSLTRLAFYPSEGCIVKMLYGSGFSFVYRVSPLPDHDDFRETRENRRSRTVIVASFDELSLPGLEKLEEPREQVSPWVRGVSENNRPVSRWRRFLKLPLRKKMSVLVFHRLLRLPEPIRMSFGARWIPLNDNIGNPTKEGRFEVAELAFVERYLKSGMTVLDIGAHHGLYSLLASIKVGSRGRVFSFEPSPRECKVLRMNLVLNWARNVKVQSIALGSKSGESDLYLVETQESGCNSLRPPVVDSATSRVRVPVVTLDEFLSNTNLRTVDFIKLDVEGAELDVLTGAQQFLRRGPRPVILVEVYDIRTQPWGYSANQIVKFLEQYEYLWFALEFRGSVVPIAHDLKAYDANLVAIPRERVADVLQTIDSKGSTDV